MILDGELTLTEILDGDMSWSEDMDGDLDQIENLDGNIGEFFLISDVPVWEGSYEVRSEAAEDQTIGMQGYRMARDLKVEKIDYFETANESGTTVYIAR